MANVKAVVTKTIRATPDEIYAAWLLAERVREWLTTALVGEGISERIERVEIDPRIGGSFFLSDIRNGEEVSHWGTYLYLRKPSLIAFTWITDASEEDNPSRVTMTINAREDGSEIRLEHEMTDEWRDYVDATEKGWDRLLTAVARLIEG